MPLVVYSALRLGLFAAAVLGLWLAGRGGWLLVVVAAVVAWAASYLLLGRSRTAAATWLADRAAARPGRRRPDADAAAEDAEAAGAGSGTGSGTDTRTDTSTDSQA